MGEQTVAYKFYLINTPDISGDLRNYYGTFVSGSIRRIVGKSPNDFCISVQNIFSGNLSNRILSLSELIDRTEPKLIFNKIKNS